MERKHLIHTIAPVFNQDSKVLLLGTFPSPKSREVGFYYSHPRNRFWTIIADLCSCDIPITKDEKIQFLLTHKIALWDVLQSCSIQARLRTKGPEPQIRFIFFYRRPLWKRYLLQEVKLLCCMKSIVFPKRVFRQLHFRLPVLPIVAWHMMI